MRLVLHREASSVLADAFELWGNAYERSILLQDFYGKEATLFTVTKGSEEEREKSKKGLKGLLEGVDTERRKRILSAIKDNLTTVCVHSVATHTYEGTNIRAGSTTQIRVPYPTHSYTEYFGNISLPSTSLKTLPSRKSCGERCSRGRQF